MQQNDHIPGNFYILDCHDYQEIRCTCSSNTKPSTAKFLGPPLQQRILVPPVNNFVYPCDRYVTSGFSTGSDGAFQQATIHNLEVNASGPYGCEFPQTYQDIRTFGSGNVVSFATSHKNQSSPLKS
uniref:CUB domain-containing protein n=1 Tax=Mesocestoides corti TaxID=53468 RepID=A0A5K3FJR8_MESCO